MYDLTHLEAKIKKILEILETDLATIRTGRATPSLIENVLVSVYGGTTKLRILELGTINTTDSQTLVITPFDQSVIREIAKGIEAANTGLTPVLDGNVIRITVPSLSQERREELIKLMRQKLENGRIMVRQARHEAMSEVKKMHDAKEISEDDQERLEKEIQKIVDNAGETIKNMGLQKEEELRQI